MESHGEEQNRYQQLPARIYFRKDEVAAMLGISVRTLEGWMRAKVISFIRIKRVVLFRQDMIDRALQRFTVLAIGETKTK